MYKHHCKEICLEAIKIATHLSLCYPRVSASSCAQQRPQRPGIVRFGLDVDGDGDKQNRVSCEPSRRVIPTASRAAETPLYRPRRRGTRQKSECGGGFSPNTVLGGLVAVGDSLGSAPASSPRCYIIFTAVGSVRGTEYALPAPRDLIPFCGQAPGVSPRQSRMRLANTWTHISIFASFSQDLQRWVCSKFREPSYDLGAGRTPDALAAEACCLLQDPKFIKEYSAPKSARCAMVCFAGVSLTCSLEVPKYSLERCRNPWPSTCRRLLLCADSSA